MKKGLLVMVLLGTVLLSGCIAVPLAGLVNSSLKEGTMMVTLEGKASTQGAVDSFRKAVRADGGFINGSDVDSATASFKEVRVDLQMTAEAIGKGVARVVIRSSSASAIGSRSFDAKDSIGDTPLMVAADMHGFVVVDQKRMY